HHKHLRSDLEEAGEASALDVIPAGSKADDVLANNLAAVVLELVVALRRRLRCQQIGTYSERADVYADGVIGKWQIRASCLIDNLILEFQIREANRMAKRSATKVEAHDCVPRVIFVLVTLKARGKECGVNGIVKVVETPKQTRVLADRVIETRHQFIFLEGRRK